MKDKLTKGTLLNILISWNHFLKRKVHLIACGGTALTLLGIKPSTIDIDFIVPVESEYDYLIKTLQDLGYKPVTGSGWSRADDYIFDLFRGKKVHTTELLESPIDSTDKHILLKEYSHIYLGILNYYDIIITKLFRGSGVDMDDCSRLIKVKKKEIDLDVLKNRFLETSSYDVSEERVNKNLKYFLKKLKEEKVYG